MPDADAAFAARAPSGVVRSEMIDHDRIFWQRARPAPRAALTGVHETDVAVIGGGISGLFAARKLLEAGKRVALLEADLVGGGASGTSSGFITADSELQVAQLLRRFGPERARQLFDAANAVIGAIRSDIEGLGIACDRVDADCLFVARDPSSTEEIREEHDARLSLGMESHLLDDVALRTALGTSRYTAGVRYGGTYAIDPFAYCQGLARELEDRGLRIFEATRVTELLPRAVRCAAGELRCERVVIATDRFTPELGLERRDVFSVQTVLALSAPLPPERLASLFPSGPLMVWDSALDYRYFRPTGDGRLLIGGNRLTRTYLSSSDDTGAVVKMLVEEVKHLLPGLGELAIEWQWPGGIGVSRDLLPIAGPLDERRSVAICGTGLPWAALGGEVAARAALGSPEELDALFDPYRSFTELELFQPLLGKPLTFALSHLHAKRWLTGTSTQVRRRKGVIGVALGVAALAALGWWIARPVSHSMR